MSDAASEVRLTDRVGIGVLTRLVSRDLIDEVLAETDRVERRHRLLPPRVVVYYVMALCLFFGDALRGGHAQIGWGAAISLRMGSGLGGAKRERIVSGAAAFR
jgi:hypothetical protein